MRGWIEPLKEGLPEAKLDFSVPDFGASRVTGTITIWRLTDSGWAVLQWRQMQAIVVIGLAAIAILAA